MPRKNGRHQPPKAPCTPDIRIRRRFRRASVGRPMIAVLVLGISAAMPAMAAARNVSDYDALIQRARAGDHKPALDMLSARVAANPADLRAAKDRLAIAGWADLDRSEERSVGKECVSTCRSRWSPYY